MPVLAPPRVAGPGAVRPNFSIERGPQGHPTIVQPLGGASVGASLISIAATPNAAAVGDLVVVLFAWASAASSISTITDTSGNSWTVVNTPAANEEGGYGYTIVTTGWASGANTVTATLGTGAPGGRLWMAASIPASYNPVVDTHTEAAAVTDHVSITSPTLAQADSVAIVTDISRNGAIIDGSWGDWINGFARVVAFKGTATPSSAATIGSYDNRSGSTLPITGGFSETNIAGNHGTSILIVKVTYPSTGPQNWTQNINDSITVPDSLSFDLGMNLADSVTVPDSLAFDRSINVADSVTPDDTGGVSIQTGKGVTINDSITVTDALTFDRGLGISDSVTPTDSLSFQRDIHLADSATVTDALAFGRDIHLADAVTAADSPPTFGYGLGINDTVTATDALRFDRGLGLADSVTVPDSLAFDRSINIADSITVPDLITPVLTSTAIERAMKRVLAYIYEGRKEIMAAQLTTTAPTANIRREIQAAQVVHEVLAAVVTREVH